jgi:ABC-type transport system involved in cytochrome bd biosynthesis fused ATPase/permease subunit
MIVNALAFIPQIILLCIGLVVLLGAEYPADVLIGLFVLFVLILFPLFSFLVFSRTSRSLQSRANDQNPYLLS